MTFSSVTVQITPESKPSTPSWMGEVAAFAQVLTHEGILKALAAARTSAHGEQVDPS